MTYTVWISNVNSWLTTQLVMCLHWSKNYSQWQLEECMRSQGLILCFCPDNEGRRYFVKTFLIVWAQAWNQPWLLMSLMYSHGTPKPSTAHLCGKTTNWSLVWTYLGSYEQNLDTIFVESLNNSRPNRMDWCYLISRLYFVLQPTL